MAKKRKKLMPEALKALEDELIEHLAIGKEVPPGAAELVGRPEFAQRLAQRKQEVALQNRALTRHILSPTGMGSLAIAGILGQVAQGVDQQSLQAEIPVLMAGLKSGDSSLLEETLLGSILTLQALAANLIAQGAIQTDINRQQTLLHLGLKAQNQLRQTVATLNELRNPKRAVFIKRQLNQLNLENSKKLHPSANELLVGAQNGNQELDSSAALETVRTNQEMETLASEYRAKITSGEASHPS